MRAVLELYGAASCQFSRELREWLEWKGDQFVEYDVEADPAAMQRLMDATGGQRSVPVLLQDGRVIRAGWEGRMCHL